MTPKIYVDGEHGTTGLQILQRLEGRRDIELLSIPHAERHNRDYREKLLNEADFAVLCLPDDAARDSVAMVGDGNTRFVDASTAHRTNDEWVFGFAELDPDHAQKIASARRVSNPGCYSTGAIALLRPLVKAGLINADAPLTINAISGYSGGGKGLIAQMEHDEGAEPIESPHFLYATGLNHKHLPEITKYGLLNEAPIFSPSVGRFAQGMLVQIPLHQSVLGKTSRLDLHASLAAHYAGSTAVRVAGLEETEQMVRLDPTSLNGTNQMDLFVFGNDQQANLVAVLDNLGKGASGACVQSLELMLNASQSSGSIAA